MRINLLPFFVFILLAYSANGQALFKAIDLVDEFGDTIGSPLTNISKGAFSNATTNDAPLLVKTILTKTPTYTLEEYKEHSYKQYVLLGYEAKTINQFLKEAHKSLDAKNNQKGGLSFNLYEYEDTPAIMTGEVYGQISIKLADGSKIKANLGKTSFSLEGAVNILGHKELTKGYASVENMIKKGNYFWEQTDIYNAIVDSKEPIDVEISVANSIYNFTMNPM